MLDYKNIEELTFKMLMNSHNPKMCSIRKEFFKTEYAFFRKHIRDKSVFVAGSGLGHDSFELARYNHKVIGLEILHSLVTYSLKETKHLGIHNVDFIEGDIHATPFPDNTFDVSVLNMGTIGNFDDKEAVLKELLRISDVVYFDFYPPTTKVLKKRQEMYSEEGWKNVKISGQRIISENGLDTGSFTRTYFKILASSINAVITFYAVNDFTIMAELYRR